MNSRLLPIPSAGALVLITVFALAGCAPHPGVNTAPTSPPAGAASATPYTATATPVQHSDTLSLERLDQGLEKLSSYRVRMTYTLDAKNAKGTQTGAQAGTTQTMTVDLLREVAMRNGSPDQHIKLTTTSSDAATNGGAVETYRVGGVTFVYNAQAQGRRRCTSIPTRTSQAMNPADFFEPREVLGGLTNARLVKPDDDVNGVHAAQYRASDESFTPGFYTTASADVWLAQDGNYVLKYVGQGNGPAPMLGEGSAGSMRWDYRIEDANKISAIQLPADCPPPASVAASDGTPSARVTGASTGTPASATALPTPMLSKDVPLPDGAGVVTYGFGMFTSQVPQSLQAINAYYKQTLAAQGWIESLSSRDPAFIGSAWCSTPAYEKGAANLSIPEMMLIYSKGYRTLTIFLGKGDAGTNVMVMDSDVQ